MMDRENKMSPGIIRHLHRLLGSAVARFARFVGTDRHDRQFEGTFFLQLFKVLTKSGISAEKYFLVVPLEDVAVVAPMRIRFPACSPMLHFKRLNRNLPLMGGEGDAIAPVQLVDFLHPAAGEKIPGRARSDDASGRGKSIQSPEVQMIHVRM